VYLATFSVESALFIFRAEECLHFEYEGTEFLPNVGKFLQGYSVSHPRVLLFFIIFLVYIKKS